MAKSNAAAVMVPLGDLVPWEGNPRDNAGAVEAVAASIKRFGFAAPIVARREDGEIIAGHTRWLAAKALGMVEVPVRYLDLSQSEARALNLADNRVGEIALWDEDKLAEALQGLNDEGASLDAMGFAEWEVEALLDPLEDAETPEEAEEAPEGGESPEDAATGSPAAPKLYMRDVPNTVWATDNEWGVPLLNLDLCADVVDLPYVRWGRISRYSTMQGTWHFYTDDDRFASVWRNPTAVCNSGAVTVTEPNYTTTPAMPRAEALWGIYRKRWLARWWQEHGLRVIVDVNVAMEHQDLALLGVPKGWKAYSTRLYSGGTDADADAIFDRCAERAGTRNGLLFLVYGGGQEIKALAMKRGWTYIPEEADEARGKGTSGPESSP